MCRVQLAVSPLGGIPGATAYHSSVLIDGEEFCFSDSGITTQRGPASHASARSPPQLLDVGTTAKSAADLHRALGRHFEPGTYDLLRKNCNSFADCALAFLVSQRLRPEYRTLERLGACTPAFVEAISGGQYVPNPRAAGFDLERLCSELERGSAWQMPGAATGGVKVQSAEAMRNARLARFSAPATAGSQDPGAAAQPSAGNVPTVSTASSCDEIARGSAHQAEDCIAADERLARQLADVQDRAEEDDDLELAKKLAAEEDERFARQLVEAEERKARSSNPHPAEQLLSGLAQGAGTILVGLVQGAEQLATALGPQGRQQQGLHSNALDANTARVTYEGDGSEEQTSLQTCAVCFDHFATGDQLRILPCLHRYHKDCIDPWLRQNRECPVCKHVVAA